jgi:archaellum component FlaC
MHQGNMSSDQSTGLHSMVAQVTSQVHRLTESSSQQVTQNAMFNTYLQKLAERLEVAEQRIAHLEAAKQQVETLHNEVSELTDKMKPKKAAVKNISNDHPILKVIQKMKINITKTYKRPTAYHPSSFLRLVWCRSGVEQNETHRGAIHG